LYAAQAVGNDLRLNVRALAAGQYILKLTTANNVEIKSLFIKQ
jgi:hypothetical protein